MSELLNGKIPYCAKPPQFSTERLESSVPDGESYRGRFSMTAQEGSQIQGFVCSTNPRMTVTPQAFDGTKEEFLCRLDRRGLRGSEIVEGELVFCTTQGEYRLPYAVALEEKPQDGAKEMPQMTPEEFAALAKEDYGRAYVMFVSRPFAALARSWGGRYGALYDGICAQTQSYHCLEQFLVNICLKTPIRLKADTDYVYLRDVSEDVKEELILTKNTWGFSELRVTSDADFVTVERSEATTEEFVGSIYSLGYFIHADRLHAGHNLARLTITCGSETICCVIEVMKPQGREHPPMIRAQKKAVALLASEYIAYRAQRSSREDWLASSQRLVDGYRDAGGTHILCNIYEAYLLTEQGNTVQGELLLSEMTHRREELVIPQWKGWYLYLSTLQNPERDYVEYVREEVSALFLQHPENWMLQWILFRLSPHMIKNDTEKLDAIRRQYLGGCRSILMYLEAWELLRNEPLLLRSLGEFEIHLLKFLCREKLLDREICGQAAQLACRCQSFDALLYGILCQCFDVYPSKNMLTAICTLLIKGHKTGAEYEKWYAFGIRQDVRITGLYEYYVESMQQMDSQLLPQSVRMYFAYHNTLDYVRKAAIYANVLRNRARDEATYRSYRPEMQRFMEEQLAAGRINRNLALLYETLLTREVLDDRLVEGLSRAMFTCEVHCANPQMRHVIVVHDQLRQEQRVMFADGCACVRIYSPHCSILLEDVQGRRYADPSLYTCEKLLTRPLFEEYCRERLDHSAGFLIHDCCSEDGEVVITPQNAGRFVMLLSLPEIKESYRAVLEQRLVEFYSERPKEAYLDRFLDTADEGHLVQTHRRELVELLVYECRMERAYRMLCTYGAEQVRPQVLAQIVSPKVREREGVLEETLLGLCARCLTQGVYDETILEYLTAYYEGPLDVMKRLWHAAQGFELAAFDLEERILALVLYQRQGMEGTEDIFASYRRQYGKDRICRAYVVLMAYEYFVREKKVGQAVFDYLPDLVAEGIGVPQVCRFALLRYYGEKPRCTPGEQKWLAYLLEEAVSQGRRFAFYRNLPTKLLRRHHLEDKFILEYRTDPADHVTLHYRLNDGKECSLPLTEGFEGIFASEFTMFYHDCLTWYFTVETAQGVRTTQEESFTNERRSARGTCSRYELINRMIEAQEKQDAQEYRALKEQYIGQEYLVGELFHIN